ncbi:hypothetical protein MBLNU459_g0233t2 [Dothideomycetes sp. NU459]
MTPQSKSISNSISFTLSRYSYTNTTRTYHDVYFNSGYTDSFRIRGTHHRINNTYIYDDCHISRCRQQLFDGDVDANCDIYANHANCAAPALKHAKRYKFPLHNYDYSYIICILINRCCKLNNSELPSAGAKSRTRNCFHIVIDKCIHVLSINDNYIDISPVDNNRIRVLFVNNISNEIVPPAVNISGAIYNIYYSGCGYTESAANPGNDDYKLPPVATMLAGPLSPAAAIERCVALAYNDEPNPNQYYAVDVHYLSSVHAWECVQYFDPVLGGDYFTVANADVEAAYGYSHAI